MNQKNHNWSQIMVHSFHHRNRPIHTPNEWTLAKAIIKVKSRKKCRNELEQKIFIENIKENKNVNEINIKKGKNHKILTNFYVWFWQDWIWVNKNNWIKFLMIHSSSGFTIDLEFVVDSQNYEPTWFPGPSFARKDIKIKFWPWFNLHMFCSL